MPRDGPPDDQGPGRHFRLGDQLGPRARGDRLKGDKDMAATADTTTPKLWVPGDWNAFFGFGTNILVNMLVLTGLLRFVLKMPDELVFGRMLPPTGPLLFPTSMPS